MIILKLNNDYQQLIHYRKLVMIIIGITGSIGMGKTTLSNMFRILKIPVFDSDKEVREILEKNHHVIEKISKIWPDTVSSHQMKKEIDKAALSNKIFISRNERKKLENIIHPLVKKKRDLFLKNFEKFSIVGLDVPLLYETQMDKMCDYVFLVYTTKRIQKKRVLIRPNMSERKFELINDTQWSYEKKAKAKPFVVNTSFGKIITFIVVLFYIFKIKLIRK